MDCLAVLLQNLLMDDDWADLLAPLNHQVKCTIIAGEAEPAQLHLVSVDVTN